MKITILFLLLSTTLSERGLEITNRKRYSKEKVGKGILHIIDTNYEDGMDVEEHKVHNIKRGVEYIENATLRPFSVVCWNQNLQKERKSELHPMDVFQYSFIKHLALHWDCSIVSIDETAYTNDLQVPIAKTFRAWTNRILDYESSYSSSHASMNPSAISIGCKCNKCF